MFKKGTCIQFRHDGKLVCGKVKDSSMFVDSGKEKLGCDYAVVIAKQGGTIDGRPLRRDYTVGDMDEARDITDSFFIGKKVSTSLGNQLEYKGTVVDYRQYPNKLHTVELTLKNATANGKPIGTLCLKIIELYSFYEEVEKGQNVFTDSMISFARYHDVDIAKVKDRHLRLERVHVKGELKITSTGTCATKVDLIDVTLEPGEPERCFGERAAELCIPRDARLTVVQKHVVLNGKPSKPSLDLQWESDERKLRAYAKTHK